MRELKEFIRFLLYLLKRKPYNTRVYKGTEMTDIRHDSVREYFYGYYDKNPEKNGRVLFHEMVDRHVNIIVKNLSDGEETEVGSSVAFNWQMGARALWLDDDIVSYNDFENGEYVSKWVSSTGRLVRTIPMPTMDIWEKKYILDANFQRLQSVDPHYSYKCLPKMNEDTFKDYSSDGIWMFDLERNEKTLLLSISDILKCKGALLHEEDKHCINHIMIAPDGKSFMFIHRYKVGGKKFDRLMVYDFKELKCILDDPLQSHFCWLDNHTIMGYCGYGGEIGWFQADTKMGTVKKLQELTTAHPKNGHPTSYGDWIVVDSYPNFARMQELHAYNKITKKIIKLAEFFHDINHKNYNRCDLHPRFTENGSAIYIDTLYSGLRQLCKLKLNLE